MTHQEQQDKQAFFALYLGSEVKIPDGSVQMLSGIFKGKHLDTSKTNWWFSMNEEKDFSLLLKYGTLQLSSLLQISDEDAIEVAKLRWGNDVEVYEVHRNHEGLKFVFRQPHIPGKSIEGIWLRRLSREEADSLRSRGYLVPFRGMSCEELINKGWVKIKES